MLILIKKIIIFMKSRNYFSEKVANFLTFIQINMKFHFTKETVILSQSVSFALVLNSFFE